MQTDFEKPKQTDNAEVNFINTWLLERYGCDNLGRPIFRLVWSENAAERRRGTFEVFTEGGVFVRRESGEKQVKKYSYLKDVWILEKLVYVPTIEIIGSEIGHYETIYVFWNPITCEYKPPYLRAVQLIINCLMYGEPMTKAEWEDMDEKKRLREIEVFNDILNEENPEIGVRLAAGEAIFVPSSYHSESEKEK